ncbi:MAG: hemerythrin domain-containing protein [bacterium]|nr:hemerythrin domain-containing protein [bacterium]
MLNRTLSSLVTERNSRAELLIDLGIDFIKDGNLTLLEVAEQLQIEPNELVEKIAKQDVIHTSPKDTDWNKVTLRELIRHIVTKYHVPLRKALPELTELAQNASKIYGDDHPELIEVEKIFGAFRFTVEAHLLSEEKILFKTIEHIESGNVNWRSDRSSNDEIKIRIREHDNSLDDFKMIRKITNNYQVPENTGETYRKWMEALKELETNLYLHMHLENNILFPRASQLAIEQAKSASAH